MACLDQSFWPQHCKTTWCKLFWNLAQTAQSSDFANNAHSPSPIKSGHNERSVQCTAAVEDRKTWPSKRLRIVGWFHHYGQHQTLSLATVTECNLSLYQRHVAETASTIILSSHLSFSMPAHVCVCAIILSSHLSFSMPAHVCVCVCMCVCVCALPLLSCTLPAAGGQRERCRRKLWLLGGIAEKHPSSNYHSWNSCQTKG